MKRKRTVKKVKIKALSNYDILSLAAKLKIPHFNGVFMRDALAKKSKPTAAVRECWILNHGSSDTDGSHWTALAKNGKTAFYFDSFGKLPPPLEVVNYLGRGIQLYYNAKKYQSYGSAICGHLCLRFLHDFWQQKQQRRRRK